ncbi:TnpV protein [Lachnospiraceae bacterium]|nr:TnpV protein [Lachnospiraceae bacterium]
MAKTIFEEMGGTYVRQGDYFIPCLTLPAEKENEPIGVWGQRHKHYLQEHKRATYTTLLTSGKLNSYLADIDEQAETMFFQLVKQMAEREGVTEQLKAENALKWTGRMNNIRVCAMELVNEEIIYN